MKVLISDNMSPRAVEVFKKAHGISVDVRTKLSPEELKQAIRDYDGLVVRSSTKVTAEVIAAGQKLKVIGRAGAGVDNIDVPAASKRGIVVMNTPGGNTIAAAEHALAMILALCRKIPQATASMKAGKWEKNRFMGIEVGNKTLGVIGNIGMTLGKQGINIGRMQFGRELKEGRSLVVLNLDQRVSGEIIERLRGLPNVLSVHELEI